MIKVYKITEDAAQVIITSPAKLLVDEIINEAAKTKHDAKILKFVAKYPLKENLSHSLPTLISKSFNF